MKCNILVMGITGVGKSSLINYLAGAKLAEAGISTRSGGITRGFHEYAIEINNQPCNVFDSEGLEVTHADYWKDMMERELESKSCCKDISQWYHIVIYCVGANSGRVQPFELDMLEKLVDAGYGVIVAFTKADVATNEELDVLKGVISNHFKGQSSIRCISVCSIVSRNGVLEGKEKLSEAILEAWGVSLIYRLPDYVYACLENLDEWCRSVLDWIDKQDMGFFGKSKDNVLKEVNDIISCKISDLNHSINSRQDKALRDLNSVYKVLGNVLNISSVYLRSSKSVSFIGKIDDTIFGEKTRGKTLAAAIALSAVSIFNPIVGVSLSITSLMFTNAKNKDAKTIISEAFVKQYKKLSEAYFEQKDLFDVSVGAELGYVYGYIGLGMKYLYGKGVTKNTFAALDYFQKVIDIVETSNFEYTNPFAEFYYSYVNFMMCKDSVAEKWLCLANRHGSVRANLVLKGIPYREVAENDDYDS